MQTVPSGHSLSTRSGAGTSAAGDRDGAQTAAPAKVVEEDKYAATVTAITAARMVVNFHPDLDDTIKEARHLDSMGFPVPETAENVMSQSKKYRRLRDQLSAMVTRYHSLLDSLSPIEKTIMCDEVVALRKVLEPGLTTLTWNSLAVDEFLEVCNRALSEFAALLTQVQKNTSLAAATVRAIATADIIVPPEPRIDEKGNVELLDPVEWVEAVENKMNEVIKDLVDAYRGISPLLIKVEGLVSDEGTGRSPKFMSFYLCWEKRCFAALTRMLLLALTKLQKLFWTLPNGTPLPSSFYTQEDAPQRPLPLFVISASLAAPEVVHSPTGPDLQQLFGRLVRGVVNTTSQFIRYQRGTCIECVPYAVSEPGNRGGRREDIKTHGFNIEIAANPHVMKRVGMLSVTIGQMIQGISRYLDHWRRYRPLWKSNRASSLEKYSQRLRTCEAFDFHLNMYSRIAQDVEAHPVVQDVRFVRIDCKALAAAVHSEARSWIATLGCVLNDSVVPSLLAVNTKFETTASNLAKRPSTLEDFKFVLLVIDRVSSESMDHEHTLTGILERYRTLRMYDIEVAPEEKVLVSTLYAKFAALRTEARRVDGSLVAVKKQFTASTRDQSAVYKAKTEELMQRFMTDGPGSSGIDMDRGVELVEQFRNELAEAKEERDQLVTAEKLFDIPVSSFPALTALERDVKGLEKVYTLYADQKAKIVEWSRTLWSEISMDRLQRGIDELSVRLKRLAKLKHLAPYRVVEERIGSFRDSIPLFSDLKNEALRPRHWKQLMDATGTSFDFNAQTTTLESLFAMNLDQHADVIADITSAAMKEVSIERGIAKIADVWSHVRFEVQRFKKGRMIEALCLRGLMILSCSWMIT